MFTNCLRSCLHQRRKQRASTSRAFEESTKPFQIDEQSMFGIIVVWDTLHYKAPFSMFNKQDLVFHNLMLTMDSLSNDLHSKGIGAQWRSAEIIAHEDEDLFWAKGPLGSESPQMLY